MSNEPTIADLREELARLKDDLAVAEGSQTFGISTEGDSVPGDSAAEVIRRRIDELEEVLNRAGN